MLAFPSNHYINFYGQVKSTLLLSAYVISLFIVGIMFGQGKEYEYKDTIYYTVVEGDTLWDISRKYLGKGYKYIQIVAENETDNPDLIYAGETYKITISYKIND